MTIGIYVIINKVNGKKYIGQSSNIEKRIYEHKVYLKNPHRVYNSLRTSKYLHSECNKLGLSLDDLDFIVLEECSTDKLLERERYWISLYKNTEEGVYNIPRDGLNNPNYGGKWSEEMKAEMSEIKSNQHNDGIYGQEWKDKISKASTLMWLDEDKKLQMAKKVSKAKRIYDFIQMTKDGECVRIWESMEDIISENPEYHIQSIYSTCSGYKKTYRGFRWSKRPKI